MCGFAVAFGFALLGNPELPKDVIQNRTRDLQIPFAVAEEQDKIKKLRLFVSEDRGKTWKRVMDREGNSGLFKFTAERDFQQYWFAVQCHYKDGKIEPPETKQLRPSLKVYINPLCKERVFTGVPF